MTKLFFFLCLLTSSVLTITKERLKRTFKNSELIIDQNQLTLNTNDSTVNFFAIADWGGLPVVFRTPTQRSIADQMALLAPQLDTKFQLGLGDNFYYFGVSHVDDPRFRYTFEDVYDSEHLTETPWFHQLGNHDHYGNAQAQINYTSRSKRWILPNFNYTIDIKTNGKSLINILMIDTMVLCGKTRFISDLSNEPNIPKLTSEKDKIFADAHFNDLDDKLKKMSESNVSYIIVGGHFPVYSAGKHGPTQCLVDRLMPLLHKYKVSAYLSGHDHNLQHLTHNYLNHTVEYMITGPNSHFKKSIPNLNIVPKDSLKFNWPTQTENLFGGFLMLQANEQNMTVNFMKADGTNLYQKVILARKKD